MEDAITYEYAYGILKDTAKQTKAEGVTAAAEILDQALKQQKDKAESYMSKEDINKLFKVKRSR